MARYRKGECTPMKIKWTSLWPMVLSGILSIVSAKPSFSADDVTLEKGSPSDYARTPDLNVLKAQLLHLQNLAAQGKLNSTAILMDSAESRNATVIVGVPGAGIVAPSGGVPASSSLPGSVTPNVGISATTASSPSSRRPGPPLIHSDCGWKQRSELPVYGCGAVRSDHSIG